MWIDSAVSGSPAGQAATLTARSSRSQSGADFLAELVTGASEESADEKPNFASMTRKELFDWMNGEIRSGRMSLDDSSPFLGMTLKVSATTLEPVDMATDKSRVNFMERAREGIAGALWQHDQQGAEQWRDALKLMKRGQDGRTGVDSVA